MNLRTQIEIILMEGMHPLNSGATNDTLNALESLISSNYVEKEKLRKIIEDEMNYQRAQSHKHLMEDRVMLAYDADSRYVALNHISRALLEPRAISNK